MDAACTPALPALRVTTAVLALVERAAAGDLQAQADVEALDVLLAAKDLAVPLRW